MSAELNVSDYLEMVMLMIGWVVNNALWSSLMQTGLALVPFVALIASEWFKVRQEGEDEGNKGVLLIARIETRLYAMVICYVFTCVPMMSLSFNPVNAVERTNGSGQSCSVAVIGQGIGGAILSTRSTASPPRSLSGGHSCMPFRRVSPTLPSRAFPAAPIYRPLPPRSMRRRSPTPDSSGNWASSSNSATARREICCSSKVVRSRRSRPRTLIGSAASSSSILTATTTRSMLAGRSRVSPTMPIATRHVLALAQGAPGIPAAGSGGKTAGVVFTPVCMIRLIRVSGMASDRSFRPRMPRERSFGA